MRRTSVAFHFLDHGIAQGSLGKHAFNGLLKNALGEALLQLGEVGFVDTAGKTRVAEILFVLGFITRNLQFFNIDHDDEIAGINVRSELRLVLATQTAGNFGRQTAKHLVRRIDDEPIALYFVRLGGKGFHECPLNFLCFEESPNDTLRASLLAERPGFYPKPKRTVNAFFTIPVVHAFLRPETPQIWQTSLMSTRDPVDKSLLRMEVRRFQTRCEAQEGMIARADSLHEVARLATIPIPFPLTDDTAALDARRQVKRQAEERAQILIEEMFGRLAKAESFAQEKQLRSIQEEFLQLTGSLAHLRTWAYARFNSVQQALRNS